MKAPTPRLEFQWRKEPHDDAERERVKDTIFGEGFFCDYGLVMPLTDHDIRREDEDGNRVRSEVFYKFETTYIGGREPFDGQTPYRDGAHASWDSEKLGNLPVWVKSYSGHHGPRPKK